MRNYRVNHICVLRTQTCNTFISRERFSCPFLNRKMHIAFSFRFYYPVQHADSRFHLKKNFWLTLIHQFIVQKHQNLGEKISEIRISIKIYLKKLSGKFNPSIHNEKTSKFGKNHFTYLTLFANVNGIVGSLFGISIGLYERCLRTKVTALGELIAQQRTIIQGMAGPAPPPPPPPFSPSEQGEKVWARHE